MPTHPTFAVRLLLLMAGVAVLAAAIYGSLQLHTLDLPIGHGICGPWGCAAEPEALLGYHAFWTLLLVPIVALTCRVIAGPQGKRLAILSLSVGLLGVVAIFCVGATSWARTEGIRYAVQRGLFDVATTPDLPVIPLVIAGLVGVMAARPGRRSQQNEPPAVDPASLGRENQTAP